MYKIIITFYFLLAPICLNSTHLTEVKELIIENDDTCYKTEDILKTKKYTLIAVMNKKCVICNDNIIIWNKLSRLDSLNTIGIILDRTKVNYYNKSGLFKFLIYLPINIKKFIKDFSFNKNQSLTILCFGKRVISYQTGLITMEEFLNIKQKIRINK